MTEDDRDHSQSHRAERRKPLTKRPGGTRGGAHAAIPPGAGGSAARIRTGLSTSRVPITDPAQAQTPQASEADWLLVGEVAAAFGTQGELKVNPATDFPERFARTPAVYVGPERKRMLVAGARQTQAHGQVLLRLDGVATIEDAEKLRGARLYVPAAEATPLAPDQFYVHDLIGLRAERPDGTPLGTITNVYSGPGNDLIAVREARTGREVLVPAVKEMIRRVDLAAGVVQMEPIAGLFDDHFETAE